MAKKNKVVKKEPTFRNLPDMFKAMQEVSQLLEDRKHELKTSVEVYNPYTNGPAWVEVWTHVQKKDLIVTYMRTVMGYQVYILNDSLNY